MKCQICKYREAKWKTWGSNTKVCDACLKMYAPEDLVKPQRIKKQKNNIIGSGIVNNTENEIKKMLKKERLFRKAKGFE